MTWERFSYICRKSIAVTESNTSNDTKNIIQTDISSRFYGKDFNKNSLFLDIINQLSSHPDSNHIKKALATYCKLNLFEQLSVPVQLKRTSLYLTFICITYILINSIYITRVAPSFIEMFDLFSVPIPADFLFYYNNWLYLSVTIIGLLLFLIVISYSLKRLFSFNLKANNNFIIRFLCFRSINQSYQNIVDALYYPLTNNDLKEPSQNAVNKHLQDIEHLGMDLSVEIQALIKSESKTLLYSCEKQIKILTTIAGIVIVFTIYAFISSVYGPIFSLGEIV